MKKLFVFFGIALAGLTSQASYLWWTVDGSESGFNNVEAYASELGLAVDALKAQVVQVNGDTKTVLTSETPGLFDSDGKTTNPIAVNLGDVSTASSYSYYIEIVASADASTLVGYDTQTTKYTDLSGAITDNLSDIPNVTVWHGSSYRAAPEPTSALLMLLGVAGLALKRKQKKLNGV